MSAFTGGELGESLARLEQLYGAMPDLPLVEGLHCPECPQEWPGMAVGHSIECTCRRSFTVASVEGDTVVIEEIRR